jgi:hypothetical protein
MRAAVARVVVATSVMVAVALGLWLWLLLVQAGFAAGDSPSPLPSPVDPWWWGPCLLVGVVAGIAVTRRRVDGSLPPLKSVLLLTAVVVGVVVVTGPMSASKDEARFLVGMHGAEGDDDAKLRAGEQACDWLTGQPWGQPPGTPWPNEASDVNVDRYAEDLGLSRDDPVEAMQIAAADRGWQHLCDGKGGCINRSRYSPFSAIELWCPTAYSVPVNSSMLSAACPPSSCWHLSGQRQWR